MEVSAGEGRDGTDTDRQTDRRPSERAATPTHAATLAVPDVRELLAHVDGLRQALRSRMAAHVRADRRVFDQLRTRRVVHEPQVLLQGHEQRLDRARQRLLPAACRVVERQRVDLGSLDVQLRALSPQATLDRGYALVTDAQGQLVRQAPTSGTVVGVRVQSGRFAATVSDEEAL